MLGVADDIAKNHLRLVKIKSEFISAACPFHKGGMERSPSFWINRENGSWGCFTCSVGNSDLRVLLRELGIHSSRAEAEIDEARKEAKKSFAVDQAKKKKKARASFKGTHVLPDALLGVFDFAPVSLLEAGYPEELLYEHDIGFDKRFDRITFPVRDVFGNIVGISGRTVIPGVSPKYLFYSGMREIDGRTVKGELGDWYPSYSNSDVRNHLYRGHLVYDRVYKDNSGEAQIILVEGFKAALWMVKHGWLNTVATMGTKMTHAQERIIRKMGATVFVFTDNNDPGLEAAHRICRRLADSTFPVYRCYYPEWCGEDAQPDDLSDQEIEEVLETSQRYGGNKYERHERWLAKKQKRKRESGEVGRRWIK